MMSGLRDKLLDGEHLSQDSKTLLLCSGICCWRRQYASGETERRLLLKTTVLLFVLLVLAEGPVDDADDGGMFSNQIVDAFPPDGVARSEERLLLDAWQSSSVADCAFGFANAHASSLGERLRSDSEVSRAALAEARRRAAEASMDEFEELAELFFRCSASAAVNSLISQREPDFVSLESAGVLSSALGSRSELLAAIVHAAESEAGQAVLRDLVLSIKLPAAAVGVRRTLLLPREANAKITKMHTEVLNGAHEAAMRGAEWSWEKDSDPVHKAAALLAGYAVIQAKTQDAIRRGDAFQGAVCLPFLECPPPRNARVPRLALLQGGEWVVFRAGLSGQPRVLVKQAGLEGLCTCLLFLSKQS